MANVSDFPGLVGYLNPDAVDTQLEEKVEGGITYLKLTQLFDDDEGEQYLFSVSKDAIKLLTSDNSVEFPDGANREAEFAHYVGIMSDAEHAAVAAQAVASVEVFKTSAGPSKGGRACLWACRRVVHEATGKWITRSDGTATLYAELKKGGMQPSAADDLPPGALIISPTSGKHVGHVGLLGEGTGVDRLVYSNHSPSKKDPEARWKQNYTVGSFTEGHRQCGLPTYLFALPDVSGAFTS